MSTGYASRLLRRTELAAELVELIIQEKTLSYQKLSLLIGVSKSDLLYFVGKARKDQQNRSRPVDIKVHKLAEIIDWVENTDFETPFFSDNQRDVVRKIKETFVRDHRSDLYETLGSGFELSDPKTNSQISEFFGDYLCYRKRGVTKLIMTFSLNIGLSLDGRFCLWEAKFLEGDKPLTKGTKLSRKEQQTRKVVGYAKLDGLNLTCIGRKVNSTEMHLINVMGNQEGGRLFWGLYSSYSREEAIARPVALVPWDEDPSHELDDRLGDHYVSDLKSDLPAPCKDFDFDLSVEPSGPKAQKGFAKRKKASR